MERRRSMELSLYEQRSILPLDAAECENVASKGQEEAIHYNKFRLLTKVVGLAMSNMSPDLAKVRKQRNDKGLKAKKDLWNSSALHGRHFRVKDEQLRQPKPKALSQGLGSPHNWVIGLWH